MNDEATQAALRDMARQLGALGATVDNLVTTWRQQEASASAGRRMLHQKVDAVQAEVHKITTKVEGALADIAAFRPTIIAVETAKERAIGAGMLGKSLWFVGGGLVTCGAWLLSHIR